MLKKGDVVILVPVPKGGVVSNEMEYSKAGLPAIVKSVAGCERGFYNIEFYYGEDKEWSYHETELFKVGVL